MSNLHRRQLRIVAMQALFQLDAQGDEFRADLAGFLSTTGLTDQDASFVSQLLDRFLEKRKRIDKMIVAASQHWDLQRMTPVDRSILRLAVCELLESEDAPPKVVINEAIELAKEYAAADSPHFINGVLDAIYQKLRGSETPEPPASDG